MRWIREALLATALAALAFPDAAAGQTVSGTVIDSATRQPLVGVAVTVRAARDSAVLRGAITDSLGRFHLPLVFATYEERPQDFSWVAPQRPALREAAGTVRLQDLDSVARRRPAQFTSRSQAPQTLRCAMMLVWTAEYWGE